MDRCYISKLRVDNVKMEDSRQYVVRAENDRGMDMVTIQLVVQGTKLMFEFKQCSTVDDRVRVGWP